MSHHNLNPKTSSHGSTVPVLDISELSFYYPGRPPVLEKINLKIWQGERVGIIGPNGAGKTTFFMLNCGVIKPSSGRVLLYDKPVKTGDFALV